MLINYIDFRMIAGGGFIGFLADGVGPKFWAAITLWIIVCIAITVWEVRRNEK